MAIVACLLFIFLAGAPSFSASGGQLEATPSPELQLVWSADYGKGEQVFFSRYKEGAWTIPIQVSESKQFIFKPVSAVGNDGRIWVVWTKIGKKGSRLQFSVYQHSRWSQPQPIETGLDDNRAVTVIVDADNRPWIAWTGAKKSYSDVFWSRWNGTGWDTPEMAHAENNVPDVNPELAIDDSGRIILSRQTYAGGKYRTILQGWDGRQWKVLGPEAEKQSEKNRARILKNLPPFPEFIKEPRKATLFIKTKAGAFSIPLSSLL